MKGSLDLLKSLIASGNKLSRPHTLLIQTYDDWLDPGYITTTLMLKTETFVKFSYTTTALKNDHSDELQSHILDDLAWRCLITLLIQKSHYEHCVEEGIIKLI